MKLVKDLLAFCYSLLDVLAYRLVFCYALLKRQTLSAISFTSTLRFLGPSNSQKKMPCHVPSTSFPPSMNNVLESPVRLALICAGEFPSLCR